jgi:methylthioribose-1-phosphate isomerase
VNVDGASERTIRVAADGAAVEIIDQTQLPFVFERRRLTQLDEVVEAIRVMRVRGAPLIGVTAAYGLALALRDDPSDAGISAACARLLATRPTAVNLRWALGQVRAAVREEPEKERAKRAWQRAGELAEADVAICRSLAEHGLRLLEQRAAERKGTGPLQVLTHCNAGWLATVDWGTALAPLYLAHDSGLAVHVWVDETRPRNQGASLTAWELAQHGIAHTLVTDNAGGHLMQRGQVDCCLVGTDRTTAAGDVCNKIGTYLKALAARDNGVPFYVAAPSSSIDWRIGSAADVPIEERDADEVTRVSGRTATGEIVDVSLVADGTRVANPAFDVTPARLVTALITERGVCDASPEGLERLFPSRSR